MLTINKWASKTQLIWNEKLRELVLSCLRDPSYALLFSNGDNYSIYWIVLTKFMEKEYNKTPRKTDKFLFLLLLTYNVYYITKLVSFADLKIAFNEIIFHKSSPNSDFTCIGYYFSSCNHCICSQSIQHIYIFYNNISGVEFNVGSVCNSRHEIIGKDDDNLKRVYQIRNKNTKTKGDKDVDIHININIPENQHTSLLQLTKKGNVDPKPCKSCVICKSTTKQDIQYLQSTLNKKITICYCIPYSYKLALENVLNELLLHTFKLVCKGKGCNIEVIKANKYKYTNGCYFNIYLCSFNDCINKFNKIVCKKCKQKDVTEIKTINQPKEQRIDLNYCQKCSVFMKNCQTCGDCFKTNFHSVNRCNPCYKSYKATQLTVCCIQCELYFNVDTEEEKNWKKICKLCYKNNSSVCTKCNNKVFVKISNKEISKGKKYYRCGNTSCNRFEWIQGDN